MPHHKSAPHIWVLNPKSISGARFGFQERCRAGEMGLVLGAQLRGEWLWGTGVGSRRKRSFSEAPVMRTGTNGNFRDNHVSKGARNCG